MFRSPSRPRGARGSPNAPTNVYVPSDFAPFVGLGLQTVGGRARIASQSRTFALLCHFRRLWNAGVLRDRELTLLTDQSSAVLGLRLVVGINGAAAYATLPS